MQNKFWTELSARRVVEKYVRVVKHLDVLVDHLPSLMSGRRGRRKGTEAASGREGGSRGHVAHEESESFALSHSDAE